MAERLAEKIERLLTTSQQVNEERLDLRRQAQLLTQENRELRHLIEHSHARIEELAGQLRRLENQATDIERED